MPDPGKGSTFTIAGRKISWDALLVAGGGIVAVILLYRAGQPVSSGSATPVDTSGGGGTLASLGTLPSAIPPSDPTQPPGLAARIAAAPATSFFTSAAPLVSSKPPVIDVTPVAARAPLAPAPRLVGGTSGLRASLASVVNSFAPSAPAPLVGWDSIAGKGHSL